jgi:arylsulfatase A
MTSRLGRRHFLQMGAASVAGMACLQQCSGTHRPPNLVILFADDLGYGDLGCYGHPTIRTPNLDRMAREGTRLTSFYVAAPTCTPSRAALLTGRYPMRSGIYRVLFPEDRAGMPQSEWTLAKCLRSGGYRTMAIGKWHLGHQEESVPNSQGFDEYYGLLYSNDMIPPWVETKLPLQLYRDREAIEDPVDQATLTERYTDEAVRFIRQSGKAPFFLYLAYTMPHVPLFASEKFSGKSRQGLYGDVVETIDWSVGRILQVLQEQGLDENTLVVFTSDNGPWLQKGVEGGSAGLLRAGKASTYEGGMRVPCLVRWPGHIPAGIVSPELATTMDLYPTFPRLAGVPLPEHYPIDGKDILPLLQGSAGSPHDAFYYYRGAAVEAVREDKWKLRIELPLKDWTEHREVMLEMSRQNRRTYTVASLWKGPVTMELFNLEEDPSERFNRAGDFPDIIERLKEKMERFASELEPGPAFELCSRGRPAG